jgi:hypothetical protein
MKRVAYPLPVVVDLRQRAGVDREGRMAGQRTSPRYNCYGCRRGQIDRGGVNEWRR